MTWKEFKQSVDFLLMIGKISEDTPVRLIVFNDYFHDGKKTVHIKKVKHNLPPDYEKDEDMIEIWTH